MVSRSQSTRESLAEHRATHHSALSAHTTHGHGVSRPSLHSVLALTLLTLLLSAAWVLHGQRARKGSLDRYHEPHGWQVVSTRLRDHSQPCPPRPTPKRSCQLQGNVVATRRQLRDCGFPAVVIVPLALVQSPQVRHSGEQCWAGVHRR